MDIFHNLLYLSACVLFIISLRSLSSPKTARIGNFLGIAGMLIAVITTFSFHSLYEFYIFAAIVLGAIVGIRIAMTISIKALPEMIAVFNGLGGLAAILISAAEIIGEHSSYAENMPGLIVGALAFSGSIVAFLKLHNTISQKPIIFESQIATNIAVFAITIALCTATMIFKNPSLLFLLSISACVLGFLLVIPIGGADMPIIISILNAYSGFAAVGVGFAVQNIVLIIVGTLVGVSGTILSYIMTKAMNRSLLNVILGGLKKDKNQKTLPEEEKAIHQASPEDMAYILENSQNIIIVPGYGLAVAQAQSVLKKMADILVNKYGNSVRFAIHPVAGRMPGHMNVLLAEAGVDYKNVFALDDINNDFSSADAVLVIGANDIVNPAAETNPESNLYGMPVLEVWKAKTVFVIKRSMASGYSGEENPLFFDDNTLMVFGDAKDIIEKTIQYL